MPGPGTASAWASYKLLRSPRGKHSALSSFMLPYPSPSFPFLSHPLFSLFPPSSLSFFNLKNVLSIFTVIRCV